MGGRAPTIALAATASLMLDCNPIFYDNNASNPPEGNDPDLTFLYANEPSCLYIHWENEDRVICAYNDLDGAYTIGIDGQAYLKARPSYAGLSISQDAGRTWKRLGVVPAQTAACGQTHCAVSLRGDPWLTQSGNRLFFVDLALASSATFPDQQAIALMESSNGGLNWSDPRIIVVEGQYGTDKESADARGHSVSVVWRNSSGMEAATSDDDGTTWGQPQFLFVPDGDRLVQNPIIVLTNLNRFSTASAAFVAYTSRQSNGTADPDLTRYQVRVARLGRTFFGPWQVANDEVFRTPNDLQINPAPLGYKQRHWRDDIPLSFKVGPNRHLWLAYRASGTDFKDHIHIVDCRDTLLNPCKFDGSTNVNWRDRVIGPTYNPSGSQFQPEIAVRDNFVSLTFYEQVFGSATAYERVGLISSDFGETFEATAPPRVDLTPEGGNQVPCVWPATLTSTQVGAYGDYASSVILPSTYNESFLWIVTAFTNSKAGCQDYDDAAGTTGSPFIRDQHIRATVW